MQSSDKLTLTCVGTQDDYSVDIIAENTFFQENLLKKKLILKYLQIDNTNIPLFIPTKLNTIPSWAVNVKGWSISESGVISLLPTNQIINPNSIDYLMTFSLTDPDYDPAQTYVVPQWVSPNLALTVPTTLYTQKQVVQDKYYYTYKIEHFLKVLQIAINQLAEDILITNYDPTNPILFIYNGDSFSLLIPDAYFQTGLFKYVLFSRELNKLFAFNSYQSKSNPNVEVLIGEVEKNYNGKQYRMFTSSYISRNWVAWDTILLTTNLPIKSVEIQTNLPDQNTSAVDYKNIIYTLNVVENSINFYPYYVYQQTTTDDYSSFAQDVYDNSDYNVSLLLYNKKNGLSIRYTLKEGEVATMNFIIKEK